MPKEVGVHMHITGLVVADFNAHHSVPVIVMVHWFMLAMEVTPNIKVNVVCLCNRITSICRFAYSQA